MIINYRNMKYTTQNACEEKLHQINLGRFIKQNCGKAIMEISELRKTL